MKKFVFDISLSVIYSFAYSQINTDSLILVLKQAPTDSNSLKNYLTLYHDLDLNEMDAKKIIGEWVSGSVRPYTLEKARQYGFDQPYLECCL